MWGESWTSEREEKRKVDGRVCVVRLEMNSVVVSRAAVMF